MTVSPAGGDKGGDCIKQGVTITCTTFQEASNKKKVVASIGETGRNGYDRGKEHLAHFAKYCKENSGMRLHSLSYHKGRTNF